MVRPRVSPCWLLVCSLGERKEFIRMAKMEVVRPLSRELHQTSRAGRHDRKECGAHFPVTGMP